MIHQLALMSIFYVSILEQYYNKSSHRHLSITAINPISGLAFAFPILNVQIYFFQ